MSHTARISLFTHAQPQLQATIKLTESIHQSDLGARLVELVQLRVSQINGCGFCVDMHWRALVRQDIAPRHLAAVAVWREAPFFSERERAALAWAELLNAIPFKDPGDDDFARVKAHFSDDEIVQLGYAVGAIRVWNMLNVGLRNPIPEVPTM